MKQLKTLILLVASVFFTGCIGDDLSDCPPDENLTLAFTYLNFPDHISRVTVAIYNPNGKLVETVQVDKDDLDAFQGVRLYLPADDYTAVCWGNAFDNTQINGLTKGADLSRHEVANPGYFNSARIPTNDALYYGTHTFTVKPNTANSETVPFTPAYIRLIIQVKGLASTDAGAPTSGYPYIRVNNLVPAYDYNMVTHGNPTTYYPPVTVDTGNKQAQATCDVLRFTADNPITIDVLDNSTDNTVLHTVNLQQFIADNNIVIADGKEVTIPILISFEGNVVIVTLLENWGNIPVDTL
ncbi:FimB/Mfa2 family fimbrial subunit [Dysgonomonas termitidis]|uniref:FimB/Mfa2 family fimbrial subunit n=1 Tax=Dysgonomonas termitidis TaxID=1516126 RepID=A0ABV9KWI2_9BACT